jgi:hypothetical protein
MALHILGSKERSRPFATTTEEHPQSDVVKNREPQSFMPAAFSISGGTHQVERSQAEICSASVPIYSGDPAKETD